MTPGQRAVLEQLADGNPHDGRPLAAAVGTNPEALHRNRRVAGPARLGSQTPPRRPGRLHHHRGGTGRAVSRAASSTAPAGGHTERVMTMAVCVVEQHTVDQLIRAGRELLRDQVRIWTTYRGTSCVLIDDLSGQRSELNCGGRAVTL